MIALFSPFIVQHIQSNECSRNGRFAFSTSREVFCDRLYIREVMLIFLSCLLLLFRCSCDVYMYVFVYTQTLVDVTCCNNRAAFVCVGGLVIVVALTFNYCA